MRSTNRQHLLALETVLLFTRARAMILTRNLACASEPGFVPQDLPVCQLAQYIALALGRPSTTEATLDGLTASRSLRQVGLADPQPDPHAKDLLDSDWAAYLRYQKRKLLDNLLNERIARRIMQRYSGPSATTEGCTQPCKLGLIRPNSTQHGTDA